MSLEVSLYKKYKGFTLDISFTSPGAGTLGILGASGSGKSMTLKCIAGILTPDKGRIVLNGRVLFDSKQKINLKPQQRRVGYLFQSYALFPHMTVAQNIVCGYNESKAKQKTKVEEMAARFSLQGLEDRLPGQLSGGQQQRVALARIFAYEPEALLLDEPFSALDTYLREGLQLEMMELLHGYAGDVLMVTHSRDEVYRLSQDLLVVDEGCALAHGATDDMFRQPGRLQVARLTGCKNFSRVRHAADGTLLALDWNIPLRVTPPLPEGTTHIGVRAHSFTPATQKQPGAFAVSLQKRVESPFEWNYIFSTQGGTEPIWWKVPKGEQPEQTPEYLAVDPAEILLLRE